MPIFPEAGAWCTLTETIVADQGQRCVEDRLWLRPEQGTSRPWDEAMDGRRDTLRERGAEVWGVSVIELAMPDLYWDPASCPNEDPTAASR